MEHRAIIYAMLLVVLGEVVAGSVLPEIVQEKIYKGLVITNNSDAIKLFVHPDAPTYMKFYFFNVSNKDEVNRNGSKPVLQEVGPYVYRKDLERKVIRWDDELGTILYTEVPTYHFEPGMSNRTPQDKINHVNIVSVGMVVSKKLDLLESLTNTKKSEMIENAPGELVESHGVDDLLFQGIGIRDYFPPFDTSMLSLNTVCMFVDNCTFAFFLKKNKTDSRLFEIKTGAPPKNSSETLVESMKHYREILEYNDERTLSNWRGESCNTINGTDGTQFPPGVDQENGLYIFSPEVCRSLYLQYEKNEAIEEIGGLRYVIPARDFASPLENPDNWCFFPVGSPEELSSLGGALSVDPCYEDSPVIASAPHFYMADPKYREGFEGLKPDKNLHESFIDVEPILGTTISAAKRLQISVRVEPDPRPKFLKFINKTTVFSVFWCEEVMLVNN